MGRRGRNHTRIAALGAALLVVALGSAVVSPSAAQADVDDFRFVSYDADYYLTRAGDGSSRLTTVETLVARFPDFDQNRGIVRVIPRDFDGATLAPVVESITDAEGEPVPYDIADHDRSDRFVEIAVGGDDFVRGEQTYVITYRQGRVTRSYDDTGSDEFYWDLNGTAWRQGFDSVTGRVHLPDDLASELTGSNACYTGSFGETDECAVEEGSDADGTVITVSGEDLDAEETVTVAIGFAPGTFDEPDRPSDEPGPLVLSGLLLGLTGLLAALGAVLRLTRWRDATSRRAVVAQYERPDGIDLLEAGEILGRARTAMSAQLIDLAVRGNLRVIATEKKGKPQYRLESAGDSGLSVDERRVMDAVFGHAAPPGKRVRIGTSSTIGAKLRTRSVEARVRVRTRGFRRLLPNAARAAVFLVALLAAIAAFGLLHLFEQQRAATPLTTAALIGAMLLAAVAIVSVVRQTRLTDEGAAVRDHLRGLRTYIELAEADRLRMLQSPSGADRTPVGTRSAPAPAVSASAAVGVRSSAVDVSDPHQVLRLYERLLPFAVLFGLEKEWASALERLTGQVGDAPGWYSGDVPFSSGSLIGYLGSARSQTSSSTWSSGGSGGSSGSGYGGSTGGGFAGGGGGGGGGGGR